MTKHQREVLTKAAAHERGNIPRGFAGPSITTILLLRDAGYIAEVRDLDDLGVANARSKQVQAVEAAQVLLIAGNWREARIRLGIALEYDDRIGRKVWRITEKGRAALLG